MATIKHCIS